MLNMPRASLYVFELVQLILNSSVILFLTVLLLRFMSVTAATPLLQIDGRSCSTKSRMKGLPKYRKYFREWSGLADGAHVHILVRNINPQVMFELLNY